VKLSIVDQSPVSAGSTPADALRNSIELAQLADQLGYERYWIAEHHGMEALASPAPEILITRIAAETSRIRVGSGGVMLPHYSPYKIAETFRMLHALYPNRIDLGIGRAPGGTHLESLALRRDPDGSRLNADDFPERLAELLAFLNQGQDKAYGFPPNHRYRRLRVSPEMPGSPDVWLLGSSLWSASAAAQFGLPYAFAHFIDPEPTRIAIEQYRVHFTPSERRAEPQAIVALGVMCAETRDEANRLLSSARLFRRRIRMGDLRPIPSVEDALRELGPDASARYEQSSEWPRYIVGDPESVRAQLTDIATALNIDEIMIVTIAHDHQARLRSYKLLAEAFRPELASK
jgi:luciferase family oxidoreductase group 1